MSSNWEQFYRENPAPKDLKETKEKLQEFCRRHKENKTRIVLVTSGGTTIPLEHITVRFVDNFSAGLRGASSTEYFLAAGYAVIFMHRIKSLEPFIRHFAGQKFLDILQVNPSQDTPSISVKSSEVTKILPILKQYKSAQESQSLLQIGFTSLSDYFWLLRTVCESLADLDSYAMLYLAAAVSDFYLPAQQMPVHKMQSGDGAPTIHLELVPKVLEPLVNSWVPKAYVVSFKLETDENLLIKKSRAALNRYNHKVVIGNLMQSRRYQAVLVTPHDEQEVTLNKDQEKHGEEIEEILVTILKKKHEEFIAECC